MSAQGSRSRVTYVVETAYGVYPTGSPIGFGSPLTQATELPIVSFGLNLSKDIYQDDTIRSDRRRQFNVHGNRTVGGDISVNLAASSFDDFIASALNSDWAANSISDGTTEKTFTVEQAQLDIGQYRLFNGVKVNTLSLSIPVNGIVTGSFSCLGKDMLLQPQSMDDTVPAASIGTPFFHAGGTFSVDADTTCRLSALELNIDNEGQNNYCLGGDSARDSTTGFTTITGTATVYFDNVDYFNRFLAQTTVELEFTLTDGVNSYTFTLPKIKNDGANTTIEGQGPVLLNVPFSAFSNAGGPLITIVRSIP